MKKVGYIYGICEVDYLEKQRSILKRLQLDTVVVEEEVNDEVLQEVMGALNSGDQLVIYELGCLGKTIIQLGEFLSELTERNIELVVVNKKDASEVISNKLYMELICSVSDAEKVTIRRRTTKGIEKAKRQGRVGGRPRISEQTIKQIHYLYHNQSYTLREIAEECDISIGTAYKYLQQSK